MKLLEKLGNVWSGADYPFLIHGAHELRFSQILLQNPTDLGEIKSGDAVAIVGDFDPLSILTLLRLIDLGVIVVPLTNGTMHDHEYFFETASVNAVINGSIVTPRKQNRTHELIENLREKRHAGLVAFTTGTTGRPKAILHDLTLFLRRFESPRPTFRTLNFLLFDHIGGLNTLFHTLFNRGVVVAPETRTVNSVLDVCRKYDVEVLPTTPTFLRLMLMNNAIPDKVPPCLRVITYGTERMDQPTLDQLCQLLPRIDFRQTYGTSELGVLRVKSEARESLFMKIGGEGVETRVVNNVLQIRSQTRMLGYLNAPSPFDSEGWYDTKDVVEEKNGFFKIVGRVSEIINVGGLKFMASEVERVALEFPHVSLVKAYAKRNPITGEHVELKVQPTKDNLIDKNALAVYLKSKLQPHMVPKRILIEDLNVGHRFKTM
jgi:acyl-CoA synthetase (AMP-forming)/AMP-acid ligase II